MARIALVKPDKARGVEEIILRAARSGQIREKASGREQGVRGGMQVGVWRWLVQPVRRILSPHPAYLMQQSIMSGARTRSSASLFKQVHHIVMQGHASVAALAWECCGSECASPRKFPQVSEERLIELLEQVNEQTKQKTKVTIQRRRAFDDDF